MSATVVLSEIVPRQCDFHRRIIVDVGDVDGDFLRGGCVVFILGDNPEHVLALRNGLVINTLLELHLPRAAVIHDFKESIFFFGKLIADNRITIRIGCRKLPDNRPGLGALEDVQRCLPV